MSSRLTLLCLILVSVYANAQVTNLKIGYQEFPTQIAGQTSDEKANLYYSGTFKGQLTVKNQVFATGQGMNDIFIVKTSAGGGKVLFVKTFGSAANEDVVPEGLSCSGNNVYLGASISTPVTFQSVTANPYSYDSTRNGAYCLVDMDTSGNVKWVVRTNLSVYHMVAIKNILHVFGNFSSGSNPLMLNDSVLADGSVPLGLVHLMFDTTGHIVGYKTATDANSIANPYIGAFVTISRLTQTTPTVC